jgi:hypothetical protein
MDLFTVRNEAVIDSTIDHSRESDKSVDSDIHINHANARETTRRQDKRGIGIPFWPFCATRGIGQA